MPLVQAEEGFLPVGRRCSNVELLPSPAVPLRENKARELNRRLQPARRDFDHGSMGWRPPVLMSRQIMAMSKGRRKDWEAGRLTGDDGGLFAVTVETTSFQLRLVFRLD